MVSVATLYTPEVLGLATRLAQWPIDAGMALHGDARSASCGSTLHVAIALDEAGRVARIGLAAQACAIGQASAAIMAAQAIGRDQRDFADAASAISNWLAGDSALPQWPGISAIAAARDYKGRHGAILLGWRAVLAAFAGQFGA
jgi:NifU-like protein involved in Fe-S cluster formation